jgi:hypothetical protein
MGDFAQQKLRLTTLENADVIANFLVPKTFLWSDRNGGRPLAFQEAFEHPNVFLMGRDLLTLVRGDQAGKGH